MPQARDNGPLLVLLFVSLSASLEWGRPVCAVIAATFSATAIAVHRLAIAAGNR
jgi:hypothetical protein